jgi:hypothetical protein
MMIDFFKILTGFFEANNIPYMLSGSVAMSIYSLPRFTRDFDFVVHLLPKDMPTLMKCFNEGYYCDEDAVKEAIKNKGMFNIIDHKSGYKADFIILKDEPYRLTEFERRKPVEFLNSSIYLVSPEDLIISKLIWIQQSRSSLQMDDIKCLLELKGLDTGYISKWITALKISTFNLV